MTSAPFHNQRTTTSTLLLQPDIDITDISPRDSPMHGSFEGLDSTEGSSSLFLTANRKKLDWNQINEEDKSSNTTNTHHRHHQKVQSPEFHENYDEMEDVTIKKERK